MKFIKGQSRQQTHLFPVSLEESIDPDNEVRVIDLFVDSLPLKDFGLDKDFDENGRPAYHPADLLKLYIYGYLNKIRSSRNLEKECKRNIEVMWLLKCLQPDHNTISNFRRDNSAAIKKIFRATVQIAKHFDLIGGRLIAGDGTKLRAQNSRKNNYNQEKIDRHLVYIENKLEEYNKALAEQDGDNKQQLQQAIEKQEQRKQHYKEIEKQIEETGQQQVSTSDPDSRQMIIRSNINEVAYNVQAMGDDKHKLLIDFDVTNNNDKKAMGKMLRRAKSILHTNDFTAVFDKGYHTGSELKTGFDLGVNVIVAIPDKALSAPDEKYSIDHFQYNKENDTYTCPAQQILTTNGNWYVRKSGKYVTTALAKHYKTKACDGCPVRTQCTKNVKGRLIERGEHAEYIEMNRKNYEKNKDIYKKRQQIIEHPFGTIKRQWGFSYILPKKGKDRASADVGFIFIAYNFRRILNIIGFELFSSYLKKVALAVLHFFVHIKAKRDHITKYFFLKTSQHYFSFVA